MGIIELAIGAVVGGAVVYLFHAVIKRKVEDTLPGDPPADGPLAPRE